MGSLPFVANASVAASASADLIGRTSNVATTDSLPSCGQCYIKPSEEYVKAYAIDKNTLCTPDKPYRVFARMTTKVICEGGGYWFCDDTGTMWCDVYIARPPCPNDTCAR